MPLSMGSRDVIVAEARREKARTRSRPNGAQRLYRFPGNIGQGIPNVCLISAQRIPSMNGRLHSGSDCLWPLQAVWAPRAYGISLNEICTA